MDKEKEIEEMARILGGCKHFSSCAQCDEATASKSCWDREKATILYNVGYGNVKQAVKEYKEEIKKKQRGHNFDSIHAVLVDDIDETFKELYGEE
ncbi:MAG: hypothetical protein NC131_00940 [Roseburia sp.]|nr:hypothetical protein [Roseburia sp.]